jgi:hypothetical protein
MHSGDSWVIAGLDQLKSGHDAGESSVRASALALAGWTRAVAIVEA